MESKTIFQGYGYTVEWLDKHKHLVVSRKYSGNASGMRGVALRGDEAIEWRDGFIDAIDDDERAYLARGIYRMVHV